MAKCPKGCALSSPCCKGLLCLDKSEGVARWKHATMKDNIEWHELWEEAKNHYGYKLEFSSFVEGAVAFFTRKYDPAVHLAGVAGNRVQGILNTVGHPVACKAAFPPKARDAWKAWMHE